MVQRFELKGLAFGLLLATSDIQSVQAEEIAFHLEEVVVTARKKEESLQDSPVAITALSEGALKDASVRNLGDISKVYAQMLS